MMKSSRPLWMAAGVLALTALAACTEKPQTGAGVRSDAPPYAGTGSNFTQPGWTVGDKTSWAAELKARQQYGQNEYSRTQTK